MDSVVAVSAIQRVITSIANDRIITAIPPDTVNAGTGVDPVVAFAAGNAVIARGRSSRIKVSSSSKVRHSILGVSIVHSGFKSVAMNNVITTSTADCVIARATSKLCINSA